MRLLTNPSEYVSDEIRNSDESLIVCYGFWKTRYIHFYWKRQWACAVFLYGMDFVTRSMAIGLAVYWDWNISADPNDSRFRNAREWIWRKPRKRYA